MPDEPEVFPKISGVRRLAHVGNAKRRYATGVLGEQMAIREHRVFLARRVREFSKRQPGLRELRRILLRLGGDELVPPAELDPTTTFLIDFGIVFGGPVVLNDTIHRDIRALGRVWKRRARGIVGIGTGYALDDDGLWREHAFGILREGIFEAMAPKRKYFGLLLIGEAADGFAETLNKSCQK
jgi:hypothetical protein